MNQAIRPTHSRSQTFSRLFFLIIGILFLLYIGLGLFLMHQDDVRNRTWIESRTKWVIKHQDKLQLVFTEILPIAISCHQQIDPPNQLGVENCTSQVRHLIDERLNEVLGFAMTTRTVKIVMMGRQPIFFVQLKDAKTLRKLYQDGTYIEEPVNTRSEQLVVKMLEGKRDPFAYPQYNCCGGDDFVAELPVFNWFLPPRIYLGDFPTEHEQIYLLRDDQNHILGGLVYLYGD